MLVESMSVVISLGMVEVMLEVGSRREPRRTGWTIGECIASREDSLDVMTRGLMVTMVRGQISPCLTLRTSDIVTKSSASGRNDVEAGW